MIWEGLSKLKQLYNIIKKSEKGKFSAERALSILLDSVLVEKWPEQLIVMAPKTKASFQLSPKKM